MFLNPQWEMYLSNIMAINVEYWCIVKKQANNQL